MKVTRTMTVLNIAVVEQDLYRLGGFGPPMHLAPPDVDVTAHGPDDGITFRWRGESAPVPGDTVQVEVTW